MSVGVLLVTHGHIGTSLLEAAQHIFHNPQMFARFQALDAGFGTAPEQLCQWVQHAGKHLDSGQGVLILTDLFGSTPCRVAYHANDDYRSQVVTGVNLSMLLKVVNHAHLEPDSTLEDLAAQAAAGGLQGIIKLEDT